VVPLKHHRSLTSARRSSRQPAKVAAVVPRSQLSKSRFLPRPAQRTVSRFRRSDLLSRKRSNKSLTRSIAQLPEEVILTF
jgi:hypothetical protein